MIYDCVKNKKIVFSSPSCQEIEPFSILHEFQEEDSLFINKQIAYCKLREEGWFLSISYIIHRIIKDGIDYGCNYALYSNNVDSVHSLLLVTLSFNSSYGIQFIN